MTSAKADSYDLDRFVEAQVRDFDRACVELSSGRKRSHWIWYIFPQMKGLGTSARSEHYGIGSLDEARAYLAHPILGPRLIQATRLMLLSSGRTLQEILGSPDDEKFRSSMTLFSKAAVDETIFVQALTTFCQGAVDERTLTLLDDKSTDRSGA